MLVRLIVVKDTGDYLFSHTSSAHRSPAHTIDVTGVRTSDALEVIANWEVSGYGLSWVDVHKDQKLGVWFYDFLFHNGTVVPSKGYVEVNSTELESLIETEKELGELVIDTVTARYSKDGNILYGVVFKKYSHLTESYAFTGVDLYSSVVMRNRLKEAGWVMVCHHILSTSDNSQLIISAVFHRDKRRRYGIQLESKEPNTLVYYGFDFYQFTSITLALGLQNYYPRYVSAYFKEKETEARMSVIFEERVPKTTFFNWFRWGLNATEVRRDVERFSRSWKPLMLSSYVYTKTLSYMVVWGIKTG